jgi:hypothetical protein
MIMVHYLATKAIKRQLRGAGYRTSHVEPRIIAAQSGEDNESAMLEDTALGLLYAVTPESFFGSLTQRDVERRRKMSYGH